MFSFETYRKRCLLQFFLDIGAICILLGIVLYLQYQHLLSLGLYFCGALTVLLFGYLRVVVLANWLFKSIFLRNLWLGLFSGFHLLILGICLWWGSFAVMLFAGIIGITPDGTEHRN